MKRPVKQYSLDSIFDFGRYKGHMVREILKTDFTYIEWCLCEVDFFVINDFEFGIIKEGYPYQEEIQSDEKLNYLKEDAGLYTFSKSAIEQQEKKYETYRREATDEANWEASRDSDFWGYDDQECGFDDWKSGVFP